LRRDLLTGFAFLCLAGEEGEGLSGTPIEEIGARSSSIHIYSVFSEKIVSLKERKSLQTQEFPSARPLRTEK
jgi:hypothetical protein